MAERSLFLWNNEYIVSLVAQQRTAVLPLVFAALERNERNHWNPQVGCIVPLKSLPTPSCCCKVHSFLNLILYSLEGCHQRLPFNAWDIRDAVAEAGCGCRSLG